MSNAIQRFRETHKKSGTLHERALNAFGGDGATHVSRIMEPFRPYITHAMGSRKWDVDGNEYIDYVMSHGGLILGHSHPDVVKAVQDQMSKGVQYGENHELEIIWAELVKAMMPGVERVEFFPCGNEASMMSVRLCRIFTGRKKVLRFNNNFHGWADELMPPSTPGVMPQDNVTYISPEDIHKVEEELAKKEYALLMTEAGGAFMGGKVPLSHDFVRALPQLCRKYGTMWILDEVVTGFRDAPGGWQSVVGVKPDLTILGKCIGGGLGAGAIAGRADIMALFSEKAPPDKRIIHSGTWNANPLTASAGVAACKLYATGEPQKKAMEAADRLREEGNKIFRKKGIGGALYGRSIVHIYLGPIEFEPQNDTLPPTKEVAKLLNPAMTPIYHRLLLALLQKGVANMGGTLFVLSAAHTKEDIDQTLKAFGESLDEMNAEGLLPKR